MNCFPEAGSTRPAEVLPDRFPQRPADPHNRRSNPLPENGKHPGSTGSATASRFRRLIGGSGGSTECIRGEHGRVIPGRHRDSCPGDCPGCEPCPTAHCDTCHRAHATGSCSSCLGLARTNLDTLLLLIENLPREAVNGQHAYHVHEGIPGGDALVLLTPAVTRTLVPRRVWPELPNDPRPPLDVLAYWADQWARQEGTQLPDPLTLGNVTSWLDGQLHRIAARPVFPHLAKDLARLLHQVENVLHAGHRPEVSRVPCWDCGTRLVKVYADDPKHDHWRCPACGEFYDRGRYDRAKHDHLASTGAERFVPVSEAAAAVGRSVKTVREWIKRDLADSSRDPATGRVLVWWPDVRTQHLTTRRRTA